jgi:hypothetical protein
MSGEQVLASKPWRAGACCAGAVVISETSSVTSELTNNALTLATVDEPRQDEVRRTPCMRTSQNPQNANFAKTVF